MRYTGLPSASNGITAGPPAGVSSLQGRFAAAAAVLDGLVLKRVEAHGKHLFSHLPARSRNARSPRSLLALLPMTCCGAAASPQIRMRLIGSTHWTNLGGPTACELLTEPEWLRYLLGWGQIGSVASAIIASGQAELMRRRPCTVPADVRRRRRSNKLAGRVPQQCSKYAKSRHTAGHEAALPADTITPPNPAANPIRPPTLIPTPA